MNKLNLKQITKELIAECEDDYVGLWSIIRHLRIAFGENLDQEKVREATLEIVSDLLKSGKIKAGLPVSKEKGFKPWDLSPKAVMVRIESEWDALGREPNIGDIVWFAIIPSK